MDIVDLGDAQKLLGFKRQAMTEYCAGRKKGELITPVGGGQTGSEFA